MIDKCKQLRTACKIIGLLLLVYSASHIIILTMMFGLWGAVLIVTIPLGIFLLFYT